MRIAYVITRSDEIGGAHVHVRDLARWLLSHGHDVRVFVGGRGVFTDALAEASVPFVSLHHLKRPISPVNDVLAVKELKSRLREYKPDIVSIHSAKAGIVGRLACRLACLPCVFTAHGWAFADGVTWPAGQIFKWLEKRLASSAKAIITVCEADKQIAIAGGVAPADQLVTIHNGMPELEAANGDVLAERSDPVPTLIMVARFEHQKDHETLIRALGKLKEKQWRLQLVGNGPLLEPISQLVADLGIESRVEFLGRRRDVPMLLKEADVFVLTTNWEGFPRSILEAMRAELPVVATSLAGIPESVENGVTGYLVPRTNPEAVAGVLSKLVDDPDLRKRLGAAGRKVFLERFTFDQMAAQTTRLYERCLMGNSS